MLKLSKLSLPVLVATVCGLCLVVATFVFSAELKAQNNAGINAAKAVAVTPALEVIPAPTESRLKWENHRLRAANLRAQIDNIRLQLELLPKQAAEEEKAADALLDEMQKAVGDKYGPRISKEGLLEFALKEADNTKLSTAGKTQPAPNKDKK